MIPADGKSAVPDRGTTLVSAAGASPNAPLPTRNRPAWDTERPDRL